MRPLPRTVARGPSAIAAAFLLPFPHAHVPRRARRRRLAHADHAIVLLRRATLDLRALGQQVSFARGPARRPSIMSLTNPVATLLLVIRALRDGGIPSAVYGGLALAAYGEPRETKDADLAVVGVGAAQGEEALRRAGLDVLVPFDRTPFGGNFVSRLTLIGGVGVSGLNTADLVEPRSSRYARDALARAMEGSLGGAGPRGVPRGLRPVQGPVHARPRPGGRRDDRARARLGAGLGRRRASRRRCSPRRSPTTTCSTASTASGPRQRLRQDRAHQCHAREDHRRHRRQGRQQEEMRVAIHEAPHFAQHSLGERHLAVHRAPPLKHRCSASIISPALWKRLAGSFWSPLPTT